VDDFLVTPTITPGVDKAQVFAGVRKLASATAVLVELSVTLNSNNGAVSVLTDVSASAKYQSVSRGTAAVSVDQAANIAVGDAPDTAVLTATHDIATDSSVLRRNGVAGTNSTGDKGAGNFLAYPLYIGRRGGTSLPFNGNLYSLIVRFGANLDAANISSTERWVGGKTGVTIA
jgi:hypothetical protein